MIEMDPNLTTPIIINATLNGTLNQPPQSLSSNPLVVALLGIVAVVIGWLLNYISSTIHENKRSKVETLQRKKQIYSKFVGVSYFISQLCITRCSILTRYCWVEAGERLGISRNGTRVDSGMYNQLFINSEVEIAKGLQNLSEIIGLIQVSFFPNDELNNLINNLYSDIDKYNSSCEKVCNDFKTVYPKNIDSLLDESCEKLRSIVRNSVTESMAKIEEYLKREIDTEEKSNQVISNLHPEVSL
ncbi:hypothetical protein RSJ42_05080 [Methanosarcina hadiensis]|uniref:hypothetical protein n=1 Tax=Methanosarcina hadiensis TaxID=3078083 RepID=UPI003977C8B0